MKKKNILITWVITILFLLLLLWGGFSLIWGMQQEDTPLFISMGVWGILLLILLPVMIMMIVTAVQRKKEIQQEDEDDLSQY